MLRNRYVAGLRNATDVKKNGLKGVLGQPEEDRGHNVDLAACMQSSDIGGRPEAQQIGS